MSSTRVLAACCLLFVSLCGSARATSEAMVGADKSGPTYGGGRRFTVGLARGLPSVAISCDGAMEAEDLTTGKTVRWITGAVTLSTEPGRGFTSVPLPRGWSISPENKKHFIRFRGRTYRGRLHVRPAAAGGLAVVNELDVDDYLKGVLPRESVPSWPAEALKVQAVTSRTFLASHPLRHRAERFDVCASTHCQMYIGQSREDVRTNRAIDATRDEVLFFRGKPSLGYFYASCGGVTEAFGDLWTGKTEFQMDYLPRKKCPWGADAAWYRWTLPLTGSEILGRLKERGLADGDEIQAIQVLSRSRSGRVKRLRVLTNAGPYDMPGDRFRLAMNGDRLRSTLFRLRRDKEGRFLFAGRGWGHGVGMCQWGSRGLAEAGRDYREILEFYFPGTVVGVWLRPKST